MDPNDPTLVRARLRREPNEPPIEDEPENPRLRGMPSDRQSGVGEAMVLSRDSGSVWTSTMRLLTIASIPSPS